MSPQSLNNLAALYSDQGRYAEAEPLYKRALAICEKALGPDHPDVGSSLNNLAALYRDQGRYAEAEPLFKRSLAIREKALGPDHPDVATSLNNLAALYELQGRYADAEPLYKRSLGIYEKALGPDHPNTAMVAGHLGSFFKSEGRIDEAEPLLTRALDGVQKALGAEHPQVVIATIQLAELYGLQGRTADADALFAKAGAATSVDLQEFPIFFGTNRKRDANQKRIAFGNERNLDELTLGVVKVVVPPSAVDGSRRRRDILAAEERLSDVRQLAIHPAKLTDADALVRAARDSPVGAQHLSGTSAAVRAWLQCFLRQCGSACGAARLRSRLRWSGVYVQLALTRELLSYVGIGRAPNFRPNAARVHRNGGSGDEGQTHPHHCP